MNIMLQPDTANCKLSFLDQMLLRKCFKFVENFFTCQVTTCCEVQRTVGIYPKYSETNYVSLWLIFCKIFSTIAAPLGVGTVFSKSYFNYLSINPDIAWKQYFLFCKYLLVLKVSNIILLAFSFEHNFFKRYPLFGSTL